MVVASAFPCVSSQSPGHRFHPAGPGSLCIFSSLSLPPRSSPQLSAFPRGPQSLGLPSCPSARGADGHWPAAVDGQGRPAAEDASPRSTRELQWEGDQARDLACADRSISSRSFWLVASVKLQHRSSEQEDGEWGASDVAWHHPNLKKGFGLTSPGRENFQLSFIQHPWVLDAPRTSPTQYMLLWGSHSPGG